MPRSASLQDLLRATPTISAPGGPVAGVSAWTDLGRDDHADHLRTLARSLIETLTDERQRAHLTQLLNGTTGDSPSGSDRYRPAPANATPQARPSPDHISARPLFARPQ